jgi:hypothetical protein
VLQPNEEGKVEISLDTRRFRGRRTYALFLQMDNGKTTVFHVTANSLDGAAFIWVPW